MKKVFFLILSCLFTTVLAQPVNVKTYIPEQAFQHFDTIKKEAKIFFPELEYVYFLPALMEHESCIHLKHSRCFNSKSELRSKRELGIGVGQLTKAYNADGSIRFDSLTDLRNRHMNELRELSWGNIANRPDLQIRAVILMNRDNYKQLYSIEDNRQRTIFMSPAYNGGLRGLQNERRACGLAKDCDPDIWFDNVEKYCLKSTRPLYAGRSACDINRHHPYDIVFNRMPKYKPHFL
jgi:hypothetical protein